MAGGVRGVSMSSNTRMRAPGLLGPIARAVVIALTVSAAGCSGDVTRFSFSDKSGSTGSLPMPPEPLGGGMNGPPRGVGLTEAPLPPSGPPSYAGPPPNSYAGPPSNYAGPQANYAGPPPSYAGPPPNYRVVGRDYGPSGGPPPARAGNDRLAMRDYAPPPAPPPAHYDPAPRQRFEQPPPSADVETIEVQPGDTLYSLARRHGVPVAAIKDANGLQNETLRPGQRLALPVEAADRAPVARGPQQAPGRMPMARSMPPPAAAPAPAVERAPAGWEGRYTLKNGDSLYGIARQHGTTLEELKRVNGITDPTKVWAGTVLSVPGRAETAAADRAPPSAGPPRVVQVPTRIINATPDQSQRSASRSDVATDAGPPAAEAASTKFRWPVRGRVIAGFGKRPDGTHNDGINLAVPQGTEVHASEAGRVAYAGNELKGYGNLILIRHANGWVSAYAHADQMLVKSGDTVRRGQVIAKAGKTGSVDQPQLHFELREGSRPVDPLPHLAN
jgi:murein DD-endopeptidase MepM/ murein hydrolase activator NlpD